MTDSLLAGLPLVVAGICGLVRHFLLEPRMEHYPKAPGWLLLVYFAFAVVLIYLGLRFLLAWLGESDRIPPNAQPGFVLMGWTAFLYKGAMLLNVLRQRYPVAVWRRLNRLHDMNCCRRLGL